MSRQVGVRVLPLDEHQAECDLDEYCTCPAGAYPRCSICGDKIKGGGFIEMEWEGRTYYFEQLCIGDGRDDDQLGPFFVPIVQELRRRLEAGDYRGIIEKRVSWETGRVERKKRCTTKP